MKKNKKNSNEKLFDILGEINEDFIDEANPKDAKDMVLPEIEKSSLRTERLKRSRGRIALAICATLVVAIGLWLFVPYGINPPSVAKYKGSEYYSVIKKLNQVTFEEPRYKNNFERIFSGFMVGKGSNSNIENYPSADNYVETTDNQVNGIIEADVIKRTDKHIFYLNQESNKLSVYSIEGENSSKINDYKIDVNPTMYYSWFNSWEMFLSEDGKRITLIIPYVAISAKSIYGYNYYDIISVNVEDVKNIYEIDRISVSGKYNTSRLIDGKLLIISNFTVKSGVDFSEEKNYLPQITENGITSSVKFEDISSPDILTSSDYTVVCKIDEKTFDVEGFHTFLSYSDAVYVSHDFVYISRSFRESAKTVDNKLKSEIWKTEIIPLSYGGERFEVEKSVIVDGTLKNQYSLDEYEGNLRVVTTTSESSTVNNGEVSSFRTTINVSLYVIRLSDMSVIGKLEKFAPDGESAESVRFDKNYAYVCTAVVVTLTDPVFFIDLSDPNNITSTDTGKIDGFSTSLVNFGEGYLLGVGYSDDYGLKIEIYKESDNGVVSVCSYTAFATFATEYKSYFIDREKNLIGLGVNDDHRTLYRLFKFTGENLELVLEEDIGGYNERKRGLLIDGYFYILSEEGLRCVKVDI